MGPVEGVLNSGLVRMNSIPVQLGRASNKSHSDTESERVGWVRDDGIAGEAAGSAAVADSSVGDMESNGSAAGRTQLGSYGHRTPVAPFVNGLCAFKLMRSFLGGFTIAMGPSMLPTLNQAGDILAVNKVPKWWAQFNTGDVVLMRSPGKPSRHLAKRILGVEGEKVTYLVHPNNSKTTKTVLVPEGHVWVQGDNIHNSYDSRKYGSVPCGLVQGRIFYRVWPPEKSGPIDSKVNPNEPPTK